MTQFLRGILNISGALGACIVVSSCVAHVDFDDTLHQLENSQTCCADYSNMSFQDLQINSRITTSISVTEPTFIFGSDGLSHFRAFRIAKSKYVERLTVRSYIFEDSYPSKKILALVPKILLLDNSYHEIDHTNLGDDKFLSSNFGYDADKPGKLEISIKIDPREDYRYILIYTPLSSLGNSFDYVVQEQATMIPVGRIVVPIGGGSADLTLTGAPITPNGYLSVKLSAQLGSSGG